MGITCFLILSIIGIIALIGLLFLWLTSQSLKSKDNFDELKKNREKVQW